MRKQKIVKESSPELVAVHYDSPPLEPWEERKTTGTRRDRKMPGSDTSETRLFPLEELVLPPQSKVVSLTPDKEADKDAHSPDTATVAPVLHRLMSGLWSCVKNRPRPTILLTALVASKGGRNLLGSSLKFIVQEFGIATGPFWRLISRPVAWIIASVTAYAVTLLLNFYGGRCTLSEEQREGIEGARRRAGDTDTPLDITCVINPVGGRKRGAAVGESLCAEWSRHCGISATQRVTTHPGHGGAIAAELEAENMARGKGRGSVICSVGGDGFLNEVINGAIAKHQSQVPSSIQITTPLAIAAEGTGNGFATSCGIRNGNDAAQAILEGKVHNCDLLEMVCPEGERRYAALAIGWGVVAEHDVLAEETLRWMGWLRSHLAPLKVIMDNATFESTLRWRGLDGKWGQIEGAFSMIHACNCAWVASDVRMAPGASIDDGLITIVLLRRCSRFELLKMFLKADSGSHMQLPAVEKIQCTEFIIRPTSIDGSGRISVDGELCPMASETHVKILPSAAKIFAKQLAI